MALPRVCSVPDTATTAMTFTRDQFSAAVESSPEVQRLRSIESAAREYRDAKLAYRHQQATGLYHPAGAVRYADAEVGLFRLLAPTERNHMTKTDAQTPILSLDMGDMFAMADRIAELQPGHWLSPSEIVRVAMARMLTDIELARAKATYPPMETKE